MSANTKWNAVIPTKGHELSLDAPEAFVEKLESTLGQQLPLRINLKHIPLLNALLIGLEDPNMRQGVQDLMDAVNKYDTIEIWAEC